MSARLKKIVTCVLVGFAVLIIAICGHNIFTNDKFLEINVCNGLTLLWTVGLSFLLAQGFAKYQKKSDIMLKLLEGLIAQLDEEKTCVIGTSTTSEMLAMTRRDIRTKIALIKKHAVKFGIEDDINFIENTFEEYDEIISNHINDLDYLAKSRTELTRPIKIIIERLYDVMIKV